MYDRVYGMSQHPGLIRKSFIIFTLNVHPAANGPQAETERVLRTQFDVDSVLGAGITLGFMAVLTA